MELSEYVLARAPWSHSKYQDLEKCALQFYRKHTQRERGSGESTESKVGVAVHYVSERVAREDRAPTDEMLHDAVTQGKLTITEQEAVSTFIPKIEKFAGWMRNFLHQHGKGSPLIEHQMAISRYFEPVPFAPSRPWLPEELAEPWAATRRNPERPAEKSLSGDALLRTVLDGTGPLLRGVLDLAIPTRAGDMLIIDHKSGAHKDISAHAVQLNIYRLFVAAAYPIRSVQCAIHYVETGRIDWTPPVTAAQIKSELRPWLIQYLNKQHYTLKLMAEDPHPPPPHTGWQCSYCEFVHTCPEGLAVARERAETRRKKGKAPGGVSV